MDTKTLSRHERLERVCTELNKRKYIVGYVRDSHGIPYGLMLACGIASVNKIFITTSVCSSGDKFDSLKAREIVLTRMNRLVERYCKGTNIESLVPLIPPSIKEEVLKFSERAKIYFEGMDLFEPVFDSYVSRDVKAVVCHTINIDKDKELSRV